jgi:hypothetical protein
MKVCRGYGRTLSQEAWEQLRITTASPGEEYGLLHKRRSRIEYDTKRIFLFSDLTVAALRAEMLTHILTEPLALMAHISVSIPPRFLILLFVVSPLYAQPDDTNFTVYKMWEPRRLTTL